MLILICVFFILFIYFFAHEQNAGTWTHSINSQERFKGRKHVFMHEHDEKINSILRSHNKEIFRVPKNGDCIYSAVCHQVRDSNPDLNPKKLRNIVCDHLIEQADFYSLFLVFKSGETFEQKVKSEQRDSGRWNTDIADLVPSAISNLFQCQIERFSSGNIPYLKIDPELPAAESNLKHTGNIQLVYSARHGMEHYDSCIDKTTENNDESTVETDKHSGCNEDESSDILILGGENDRTTENNDEVNEDESTVETDKHSGCNEDESSDIIILGGENVKDMATDLSDSFSNKIMSSDIIGDANVKNMTTNLSDSVSNKIMPNDIISDIISMPNDVTGNSNDIISPDVDDLGDVMSNDTTNLSDDWTELIWKSDIQED